MKTFTIRRAWLLFLYGCFGAALATGGLVIAAWKTGLLDRDKLVRIVSIMHEVDPVEQAALERPEPPPLTLTAVERFSEHLAADLIMRQEDLRAQRRELHYLIQDFERKRERYEEVKQEFEENLGELVGQARTQGLRELRNIWQNIRPDAAKDQIMTMVRTDGDKGYETALLVLRRMAVDEKSLIIERFVSEEEQTVVHRLLESLAAGEPETEAIQAAAAEAAAVHNAR